MSGAWQGFVLFDIEQHSVGVEHTKADNDKKV